MKEKFKKYQHLVKPYDIIIVITLFILSFLPNAIFAVQQMTTPTAEAKIYAVVTINGEEVQRFELKEDTPREEFIYFPSDDQYNIIENKMWVWLPATILILVMMLCINYIGQAFQRAADARQRLG